MAKLVLSVLLVAIPQLLLAKVWDLELCKSRESHWTHNNHGYVYSGKSNLLAEEEKQTTQTGAKEANLTAVTRDWAKAGDWCQKRCMDLVSLETEAEWEQVRAKMEEFKAPFIWTSGHKCDRTVDNRCFTDPSLQPRLINGWFWSGSNAQIAPTNKPPPGWKRNPWGKTGIFTKVNQQEDPNAPNVPQPDNAEQRLKLLERKEESCLALATNLWQSDTVWNDIACYHQKEWICEDSDTLLKEAGLA